MFGKVCIYIYVMNSVNVQKRVSMFKEFETHQFPWTIFERYFPSMDWLKGTCTRNHGFSHEIYGFPLGFALNQSNRFRSLSIEILSQTFHPLFTFPFPGGAARFAKVCAQGQLSSTGPRWKHVENFGVPLWNMWNIWNKNCWKSLKINDGTSPKKEHSPENGRSIVGYNGTICSNRPKPFFAGIMCPQWYPKSGSSYAKKEQHQWFLTFHVLAQTRIHVKKWHTSPKIRGILYDLFMCRKIVCLKHVWGSIRKKCGTMWPSRQLWPSRNAGQFLLLLGPLTSYYGSKPWYSSPEQPVNKWSFP